MSDKLEQLRMKAIISKVGSQVVCALPILFMLIYAINEDENIAGALFGGFIMYSLLRVLYATFSKNIAYTEFVQLYKREMINKALNGGQLYDNMEFSFESGINPDAVYRSGFLSTNRYYSDCFMTGSHNDIEFVQADIRNVRGQRGGYVLEYDGTFMVIPTYLPDASVTVVANRNVDISYILPGKDFESPAEGFRKTFSVNSTNHEKAAALITPDFMGKLLRIQNQITGRIALSVRDGYMYIFITKHGSKLKPRLFGKYDDSMKASITSELSRAKLFIDAFSVK